MTQPVRSTAAEPRPRAGAPTVAIVGAGVAGLACAQQLVARGVSVTVFEKSRGVGGRAATRRAAIGDGTLRFDHGAQYFTVRDAAFASEVRRLEEDGSAARWRGRIVVLDRGAVQDAGAPRVGPERWVALPGMSALGGALARGLDVRLGARATTLHADAAGWRVELEGGDSLGPFDAVAAAMPAPQAAALLAPAAPALARSAGGAVMTPCWSVMLGAARGLELPFDGAFVGGRAPAAAAAAPGSGAGGAAAGPGARSPLSWVARDSSKPGRAAVPGGVESWVLHATPEWSAAHLALAHDEVADRLVRAFAAEAGLAPIVPRYAAAHRWRFATPAAGLDEACLFDAAARVGACGDWCGGPRVEGAFLSGRALAAELLAALG